MTASPRTRRRLRHANPLSSKVLAIGSRDRSFVVTFSVRCAFAPNGSVYNSDRRPDAARAHDTHPALKMSSRALPPLLPLSTACRTWQHWQGLGSKRGIQSREAASQQRAPALNATYQVSLEVLPPASRLPAQNYSCFAVWSQFARLRAVDGLMEALARKCTLR